MAKNKKSGSKIPVVKSVRVATAKDASSTMLAVDTVEGRFIYGLRNKELAKLAALLITQSAKVASRADGVREAGHHPSMTLSPIPASHMGIAPGRVDKEAMLLVGVGNLNFCFSVCRTALEALLASIGNLDDAAAPVRPS